MTTKDSLKDLIDQLPDEELHTAKRFIEYLRDAGSPLLDVLLEAPEEADELNEEAAAALREAELEVKAGDVVTHAELKRELSL